MGFFFFLFQVQVNPHTYFKNCKKKKNLLKLNANRVNRIFVKHFDFNKAAFSGESLFDCSFFQLALV